MHMVHIHECGCGQKMACSLVSAEVMILQSDLCGVNECSVCIRIINI